MTAVTAQNDSVQATAAHARMPASNGAVAPLAASLQATLAILLRKLGQLLAYQAQVRFQSSSSPHTSEGALSSSPGWRDLVAAAHKWQRDVSALSRWINQAQSALVIEHQRAKAREAVKAQRVAEADRQAKEREVADRQRQSEAAKTAEDHQQQAVTETSPTSLAAKDSGHKSQAGVIDLTTEDDVDTAASTIARNATASDASIKRPREGEGESSLGQEQEGKKQRLEEIINDDATVNLRDAKLQELTTVPPTGIAGVQDNATSSADPQLSTTKPTSEQEASNAAAFNGLDMSSMTVPDLSGVDFSQFMNTSMQGDIDFGAGLDSSTSGGGLDMYTDGNFGGAAGPNGADNAHSSTHDVDGGIDMSFMQHIGDADLGGNNQGDGGLEGMDFSAVMEGVDWNSLMETFNGHQGS